MKGQRSRLLNYRSRFYADPEGEPSVPYGASKYAELPFVEADSPRLEILQTQSFGNTLLLKISNGVHAERYADLH